MKYLKMIGLAAVAAMALTAFGAGTASATTLASTGVHVSKGATIHATLEGSAKLTTTEGTTLNTCTTSTIHGTTSTTGSATETVIGSVAPASLTWANCTNPVNTLKGGELEIHHIAGTSNGTLTAKGFEVTVQTPFGSCVFTAGAATHMGTLTGATSGFATMDINAVVTRVSGLCPSSARWVANYVVTTPHALTVSAG